LVLVGTGLKNLSVNDAGDHDTGTITDVAGIEADEVVDRIVDIIIS
jgi:hypothetical protein